MALKHVRAALIKATGRRDLVNSDGSDKGGIAANWFINAGQRMLDGMLDMPLVRHAVNLPAGAYHVALPGVREIHEVTVATTNGRCPLEHKPFMDLWTLLKPKADSGLVPPVTHLNEASGGPRYYSPSTLGLSPDQNKESDKYGFRLDLDGAIPGDSGSLRGLLLYPVTNEAITLTVFGRFGSPQLEDDYDQSWWSENSPEILVHAGAYQIEAFYRNTEGSRDWLAAINRGIASLDRAQINEAAAQVRRMKG